MAATAMLTNLGAQLQWLNANVETARVDGFSNSTLSVHMPSSDYAFTIRKPTNVLVDLSAVDAAAIRAERDRNLETQRRDRRVSLTAAQKAAADRAAVKRVDRSYTAPPEIVSVDGAETNKFSYVGGSSFFGREETAGLKGGNQASGGNSKSNDSRNAKLCAEVGKYDDGSRNTSFNNAENGSARMYGGIDLDQLDAQLGALDDEVLMGRKSLTEVTKSAVFVVKTAGENKQALLSDLQTVSLELLDFLRKETASLSAIHQIRLKRDSIEDKLVSMMTGGGTELPSSSLSAVYNYTGRASVGSGQTALCIDTNNAKSYSDGYVTNANMTGFSSSNTIQSNFKRSEHADSDNWNTIADRYSGNVNSHIATGGFGNYADHIYEEISAKEVLCYCKVPCVELTSRKDSSMNRKFYKCANSGNQNNGQMPACDFFEWADSNSRNDTNQFSNFSSVPISNMPALPGVRDYMSEVKRVFGHNSFRHGQRECIEAALSGRDVFCLMPTGGGKSLVYQLPAVCCPGIAVVFSPLISLIQDQVDLMNAIGIRAAYFAAAMSENESRAVFNELRSMRPSSGQSEDNEIKLLYLTPEKFSKSDYMRRILKELSEKGMLSRFILDEAHCISQWGHDFRPDYLSLRGIRELCPEVPIMALTATANLSVVNDVVQILQMRDPFKHSQSFNRPNIEYSVRKKTAKTLTEDIPDIIRARIKLSGIIYCLSKRDTEKVSELLQEKLPELRNKVTFYHADVPPEQRESRQRAWCKGDIRVIVATIAFGMGINKPDVRYVIHYSLPKSLTNYYQESGRAGRDGDKSECILYFAYKDKSTLASMIMKGNDSSEISFSKKRDSIKSGMDNLFKCVRYCINEVDCRRTLLLEYFGEAFPSSNCGKTCDNCRRTGRVESIDFTADAQRIVKCAEEYLTTGGNIGAPTLNNLGKIYMNTKGKGMEKFDRVRTRCLDNKKLTRDLCERLLQLMVLEGYLLEESKPNASGFSADYINLGPRAHELSAGRSIVCLNVRLSGDRSSGASPDDFDDIENSPNENDIRQIKKNQKRKNVPVIEEISDEEDMDMSLNSLNGPSYNGNKKFKGSGGPVNSGLLLHKPQYIVVSRNEDKKVENDSFVEMPIHLYEDIDDSRNDIYRSRISAPPTVSSNGNNSKIKRRKEAYVLSDSDEDDGAFEEILAAEKEKSLAGQSKKTGKRPVQQVVPVPDKVNLTAPSIPPLGAQVANEVTKFSLSRQQKAEFEQWLYEYRKRWPHYWNYMDNQVVKSIVNTMPMTREELSSIPKFGHNKTTRFGEHILATIWAFMQQKHLLDYFPEQQRVRPTIPDCPTWLDPFSHEADEIRNKSANEEKMKATSGSSGGGNQGTENPPAVDGPQWLQAGVVVPKRLAASVSVASPHFNPPASKVIDDGEKNIYSPTDHTQHKKTPLKDMFRRQNENLAMDFTSPAKGFQSHSLSSLRLNAPASTSVASSQLTSSQIHGAAISNSSSPAWITAFPKDPRAPGNTTAALPPAESVYGNKANDNAPQSNKRVFSMEY